MSHSTLTPKAQTLKTLAWEELSRFTSMGMIASVVTAWYCIINKSVSSSLLAGIIFLIIIYISHFLLRLFNIVQIKRNVRRFIYIGWIVFGLVVSMQILLQADKKFHPFELLFSPITSLFSADGNLAPFWHTVIILILVWAALTIARLPVDSGTVTRQIELSLAAILFLGLIQINPTLQSIVIPLYCVLLFGLVAVSTARISDITSERGGRLTSFRWQWGASILAVALLTVVVGLGLGWLFAQHLANLFVGLAIAALIVIAIIAGILVLPFLLFITGFIENLSVEFQNVLSTVKVVAQDPGDQLKEFLPKTLKTPGLVESVRPYFLIGILVIILLFILYRVGWLDWIRPRKGTEEGESIINTSGSIQPQEKGFKHRKKIRPGQILAAARIRQIYAQLLRISESLGKPRPPANTPLEFLPTLEVLFPENSVDIREITLAYTKIRYGQYPESEAEVRLVEQGWNRIRAEARKQILDRKRAQRRITTIRY